MAGIRLDSGFLHTQLWADAEARTLFITMLLLAKFGGVVKASHEELWDKSGLGSDFGEEALDRLVHQYGEVQRRDTDFGVEYVIREFGRFRRPDPTAKERIARYRRKHYHKRDGQPAKAAENADPKKPLAEFTEADWAALEAEMDKTSPEVGGDS